MKCNGCRYFLAILIALTLTACGATAEVANPVAATTSTVPAATATQAPTRMPHTVVPTEAPADTIVLIPFTNEAMAISGVVPAGWQQAGSGVYLRPDDPITRIIQQAAPGATAAQVEGSLVVQLGLAQAPEPVDAYSSAALTWELYQVEIEAPGVGAIVVDVALAEADGTAYVILLQATPEEHEALHTSVFRPALESFAPLGAAEQAAVYEDPSGLFSVPIPTNWTAEAADGYGILKAPDNEILFYVAAIEAESVAAGLQSLWAMVEPGFSPTVSEQIEEPATRGEDEVVTLIYESAEDRVEIGGGWLHQGIAYLELIRCDLAAYQRRASQVQIINSGFDIYALEKADLSNAEPLPLSDDLLAELESYIQEKMEQLAVPGASVAIVHDGEIVYSQGFGVLDRESQEPVTPETLMMIGSSTKSLTTMMMAALVDEGTIGWDTPVVEVLPSFAVMDPDLTSQITMRNLVCACTGVPRRDLELAFNSSELTAEGIIESLATFEFYTDFGEAFQYSNQMVATAGFLSALAAGGTYGSLYQDYVSLMQERVLDPLGMSSSTFSFDQAEATANRATPHVLDLMTGDYVAAPVQRERMWEPVAPAASLWSTVLDMGRYLITELDQGVAPDGPRVVSAENLGVTWEPQVAVSAEASYGLGWFVDEYKGLPVIHHGGNTLGFSSALAFIPSIDLGVSVLSNQWGSLLNDAVWMRLLEMLFEQPQEYDATVQFAQEQLEDGLAEARSGLLETVDADAVAAYLGLYTNAALGTLELALNDGLLTADAGEFQLQLLPHADAQGTVDSYVSVTTGLGLSLRLAEDDGGRPIILIGSGSAEYRFDRVP